MTTEPGTIPDSESTDDTTSLDRRLPFCPQCGYALQGLPADHRCPECGLAFDAGSRMWVAKLQKGLRFWDPFLLFWILYFPYRYVGMISEYLTVGTYRNWKEQMLDEIFIVLYSVLIPPMFFSIWLWYRRKFGPARYLVVMPDGLVWRDLLERRRRLPWDDITSAEPLARPDYPHAIRVTRANKRKMSIVGILSTDDETRDAIALIFERCRAASAKS